MAFDQFDVSTTRRLALGLFATSGAILLTSINLAGSAIVGGNADFASKVILSIWPLAMCAFFSLISFIFAELAAHPKTPETGHPHSKPNYLQSAFVFLTTLCLTSLLYGTYKLITALL